MTSIVKWTPSRELDDMQSWVNRLFTDVPVWRDEESFLSGNWTPAVDIQETDKEYAVKVDLPEVKKEDIKINLLDGTLSIEGERREEREEKGKKFHRIERQYGQFVRRFVLPEEVDAANVQAQFKDGVLKVTLPKSPAAMPKSVEVKVT